MEKSTLKLGFAEVVRASRRWQRVKFTEKDLGYFDKLRRELGLEVIKEEVTGGLIWLLFFTEKLSLDFNFFLYYNEIKKCL